MNKKELINTILIDIKELETMMDSFHGIETIPEGLLNMALMKSERIIEHVKNINNCTSDYKNTEPQQNTTSFNDNNNTTEIKNNIEPKKETIINDTINETSNNTIDVKVVEETEEIITKVETDNKTQEPTFIEQTEKIEIKEEKIEDNIDKQITKTIEVKKEKNTPIKEYKKSINDKISDTENKKISKIMGKPITDLTKSLGINDRFFYQRELFQGNVSLMTKTLQELNNMDSYSDAYAFIVANFDWDEEEQATSEFLNYIQRRFI